MYSSKAVYDPELCVKIGKAIKRSGGFNHVNPIDLIKKKYFGSTVNQNFSPEKRRNSDTDNCALRSNENIINTKPVRTLLPLPESVFPETDFVSNVSNDSNKVADTPQPSSPKVEVIREQANQTLSNLAVSLLPDPMQIFIKPSLLNHLDKGNLTKFTEDFNKSVKFDNDLSVDDFREVIQKVVDKRVLSVLPSLCSSLTNYTKFSDILCQCYLHHYDLLCAYKLDILACLGSMIQPDIDSTINNFIKAAVRSKEWTKVFNIVFNIDSDYLFDDNYFQLCMDVFKDFQNTKHFFDENTLSNILSYIRRNYSSDYDTYMIDICLYIIHNDIDIEKVVPDFYSLTDSQAKKIIERLSDLKAVPFFLGLKILSRNWNLIFNELFSDWFGRLISDKNDSEKCLMTLKSSIESIPTTTESRNYDKALIIEHFYFLCIRIMGCFNRNSLCTSSKNVYDRFLKYNVSELKEAFTKCKQRFKFEWTMVECLISAAEYEVALSVIKEYEVMKHLEASSPEYNRVKEMLPNLVWHLKQSDQLLPVITLFEEVVSVFIFKETPDSAYTKNCNEIFNLIVVKAYESNNIDVVRKMISLLDIISSADIGFTVSRDCYRYLTAASVRTGIPFTELIDFIDSSYKLGVYEPLQTVDDGYGLHTTIRSEYSSEELAVIVTWICRRAKIRLVELAQSMGSLVRDCLTKVCSITFHLSRTEGLDLSRHEIDHVGIDVLVSKLSEALSSPKYLSHSISFTVDKAKDPKITCDSKSLYNAIYYSDI